MYPLDVPVLTGWLGGPAAEKYSEKPDEFFLNQGLETLASVFAMAVPDLRNKLTDYRVFNWQKDTRSRGAYSYPTVESYEAKLSRMKSLAGRIYFAGEAFYEGPHPGTSRLPWSVVMTGPDSCWMNCKNTMCTNTTGMWIIFPL